MGSRSSDPSANTRSVARDVSKDSQRTRNATYPRSSAGSQPESPPRRGCDGVITAALRRGDARAPGSERMRAVVYDRYGPPEVLRLDDVPRPAPKEDEVLIKIHATTVTRSDCGIREANASSGLVVSFLSRLYSGLGGPKRRILGAELAGEVTAVGGAVSEFAVGDPVFGTSAGRFGAHAEFICMRESAALAHKPAAMTFEEAAAVCDGAMLALGCLRQADLRKGRRILVYGASGSIGTAGVQLAKYFGADVTAVCGTKNIELVRSLGADAVIDYTREDFTQNGQAYDVVFDAVGKHSFNRSRGLLKPGGSYLPTDGFKNLWLTLRTARSKGKKVRFQLPPQYARQDLRLIKELVEAGEVRAGGDRRPPLGGGGEGTGRVGTQQKGGKGGLAICPT